MKKNKNLYYLLNQWISNAPICFFNSMKLDSRKIKQGNLFIAIKGDISDGRNFISEAINKGAVAILAEANGIAMNGEVNIISGIPIIYFSELNQKLSTLGKVFYENPGKTQKIIGVTGTNGKTTITQLLSQWVTLLGEKSAVIGTMGYGIIGNLKKTNNTTESAIDTQKILYLLDKERINLTAMEISSHALVQYRVADILFSAGVFTNLSHDHLDYHNDMKKYALAKRSFFFEHKLNEMIINADDKIGSQWLFDLPSAIAVSIKKNYRFDINRRWLKATNIIFRKSQINIYFDSSWGSGRINSALIGNFNISNLLIALATLLSLNYPLNSLLKVSSKLLPINGRMELFVKVGKPKVILDYAHTPEALKKALIAARQYCTGKIWCLFGCGGERDKTKRPIMAAIAEKFADIIIVTQDNPRNENQYEIIKDILHGFVNLHSVYVINNRSKAINQSIRSAYYNDLILIAGKGHEEYQIIGNNRFHYSDRAIIKSSLEL
ncbi:UDP-N-acetylmuramoyl-L-alanyl-D-glutamate--2,6-diaminopimelate ligase [Candidatus Pantoea edessiphila]|uniref:UDP-N-acetylmuramoyl-L-alanyl-D-glutamate--2,6-diaminopimelate ligase n=1 Tax=Candidatus Pantoea edessiphila TaxID=2044610 RepID=A0A2P5T082_9GAMM|nr:UDP-N-acetylmuramoyl-L-alanyl-D-glutamate--2,6-diaminopimelate ligase [Candidatus Pantoea edessiphila]PPI87973.1 UDP-N-acetylmuramoyl-L-alanyl-D-glutamate--2,6-diaminopimelate ligase [Candidatus Pantoea edessiphila]